MKNGCIAKMTWEEFHDLVQEDSVAVIPIGSVELEGPHLPLGVDTITAEAVARGLDAEPGVLVGPTLPVGYSKWFMPFAGTISLEMDTLVRVLSEYAGSLVAHGVRRIVFLNAHRGNSAAIEAVAHSLIAEKKVRVAMISVWKLANDLAAAADSGIVEGRFTHAGEVMTSVMMTLAPEAVKADRIRADRAASPPGSPFKVRNSLGETEFNGSVQILFQDIRQITSTGTLGDPGAASAAKGRALLEAITGYARAFIAAFRQLAVESER